VLAFSGAARDNGDTLDGYQVTCSSGEAAIMFFWHNTSGRTRRVTCHFKITTTGHSGNTYGSVSWNNGGSYFAGFGNNPGADGVYEVTETHDIPDGGWLRPYIQSQGGTITVDCQIYAA
jgi:hypothetical protein